MSQAGGSPLHSLFRSIGRILRPRRQQTGASNPAAVLKKRLKYVQCYLRIETVYIPTSARYENGLGTSGEPVAVVPVQDTAAFRQALLDAAARPPVILPTPVDRYSYPKSILLPYAKVKTWGAFFKEAHYWTLDMTDWTPDMSGTTFGIVAWRKDRAHKSWSDSRIPDVAFPPGTSFETAADRLVEMVQQAAQQERENKPNWKK